MISGLIIAGNKKQADNWIKENGLSSKDYRYISKYQDYVGYHNLPIFLVGEYFENPSYIDLICFNQIEYVQNESIDKSIVHMLYLKYGC